jgi:hypothetical protein
MREIELKSSLTDKKFIAKVRQYGKMEGGAIILSKSVCLSGDMHTPRRVNLE